MTWWFRMNTEQQNNPVLRQKLKYVEKNKSAQRNKLDHSDSYEQYD